MEQKNSFKVVMVGDGGCGKTTFITRHLTGEFTKNYIATIGVKIVDIPFVMNVPGEGERNVTLNIWDCAGQEKFSVLSEEYYRDASGVIIMFDVTSKVSYRNVNSWYRKVRAVLPTVPIILCGNKVDCSQERKVLPQDIVFHRQHSILAYYDISAKSNYNYDKPFLRLIRKFLGQDDATYA